MSYVISMSGDGNEGCAKRNLCAISKRYAYRIRFLLVPRRNDIFV
jgi:hypothetical protein